MLRPSTRNEGPAGTLLHRMGFDRWLDLQRPRETKLDPAYRDLQDQCRLPIERPAMPGGELQYLGRYQPPEVREGHSD